MGLLRESVTDGAPMVAGLLWQLCPRAAPKTSPGCVAYGPLPRSPAGGIALDPIPLYRVQILAGPTDKVGQARLLELVLLAATFPLAIALLSRQHILLQHQVSISLPRLHDVRRCIHRVCAMMDCTAHVSMKLMPGMLLHDRNCMAWIRPGPLRHASAVRQCQTMIISKFTLICWTLADLHMLP